MLRHRMEHLAAEHFQVCQCQYVLSVFNATFDNSQRTGTMQNLTMATGNVNEQLAYTKFLFCISERSTLHSAVQISVVYMSTYRWQVWESNDLHGVYGEEHQHEVEEPTGLGCKPYKWLMSIQQYQANVLLYTVLQQPSCTFASSTRMKQTRWSMSLAWRL